MVQINTVSGAVEDGELGIVLPFERIVDDQTGAGDNRLSAGNREIVRHWAEREFESLAAHGGRTLVDVTPIGGGRDVALMRQLQQTRSLRVLAATGFGPPQRRPAWLHDRKAKKAADGLVRELTEGIAGTDARAALISLVSPGAAHEEGEALKVIGLAHQKTGAPVVVETAGPPGALIDALEAVGLPPHCVALGHAGAGAPPEDFLALAARGVSLIFTDWGIAERAADPALADLLSQVIAAGGLDRLMLSVAFAFRIRDPNAVEWPLFGVPGRTYAYLFREVLPMLRGRGLTDGDLWQMMVANPAAFLAHGGQDEETCRFCAHHRH